MVIACAVFLHRRRLHHIHPSAATCMFQYRAETVQLFVPRGTSAEAPSWKKSHLFKKCQQQGNVAKNPGLPQHLQDELGRYI